MSWTLVTGGAKRLGAEICRTLAAHGHNILVHYNTSREDALEVVKHCKRCGVKADCIQGDFSSAITLQPFIDQLIAEFSGIDTLINNVGQYYRKPVLELSVEEWAGLFQINVHAPYALIQALIPQIKLAQGNIINIGISGLSQLSAAPMRTGYNATKTDLLLLTRSLALQLAPHQVRVNMVSPGQLTISVDHPNPNTLPMRRLGTPEDVVRAILFLLDKKNNYITGQNIEVAGGLGL